MSTSPSPPARARATSDTHRGHGKRDSSTLVSRRRRRDSSSKHRDHYHERSKRLTSSSDSASSSTSSSSSSDEGSSDSGSSQSSSSSDGHRRKRSRSRKRKHHSQHRDVESSSDSDSDGPERSRKHRRRDSSKKVKDVKRKESSKHKTKKHRRKEKSNRKDGSGPVQLSKFLGRDKDNGVRRSVVSGKKCVGMADSNEGGEDQRGQSGRDESHGVSEISELQLRLNHHAFISGFEGVEPEFTYAWRCLLIARNCVATRFCFLSLDSHPMFVVRFLFQTKTMSLWANLLRAPILTSLVLGVIYRLHLYIYVAKSLLNLTDRKSVV